MTLSASRTSGPMSRRYAAASDAEPGGGVRDRALEDGDAAAVERVGEGRRRVDQLQPEPRRSRSRKNGDAVDVPWTAEQTSWTNPGRVSSALRIPPPIVVGEPRRRRPIDRRGRG